MIQNQIIQIIRKNIESEEIFSSNSLNKITIFLIIEK